jgi:hypothetical protein
MMNQGFSNGPFAPKMMGGPVQYVDPSGMAFQGGGGGGAGGLGGGGFPGAASAGGVVGPGPNFDPIRELSPLEYPPASRVSLHDA